MKKITVAMLALLSMPLVSQAQLVNTQRIQDNYWFLDDKQIQFGALPDVACEYDSGQTSDALVCGLSADSERFILTQKADMGTNFALTDLNSPGLSIMSAAGTKAITLYHDGTNGIIDVEGGGVVSFPDGIAASVTPTGMMTFAAGAAVTAASYQMGRDADGTNQLHFNAPTGASMEFSVNDTPEFVLNATSANFQNNSIATAATNAAGASAAPITVTSTLGIMDGSDSFSGLSVTVTNANHTGVSNVVNGVSIPGITGDADATETGILLGDGWDVGINAGNNQINARDIILTNQIRSTSSTDIGWSVVTGANTACTTTCTNGCVYGQDVDDANKIIVDCASAAADRCVCAGAN